HCRHSLTVTGERANTIGATVTWWTGFSLGSALLPIAKLPPRKDSISGTNPQSFTAAADRSACAEAASGVRTLPNKIYWNRGLARLVEMSLVFFSEIVIRKSLALSAISGQRGPVTLSVSPFLN